ncbi:hypothetical protein COCSUDRAFT_33325 [Coccomyxa subellipsoidea C-169]|uniref:Uncharacterized protein n=1 Tax=Coccomyxa subellipsoidea (strain C-169) TaxID=574566 RepID=I0YW06_COCSC|nr:hypothetical protein COCSUDRAFT_33325 [Coccomyxa subellipsoidea C-169]EIE22575.1 hypothetical protein COCSUDRAFT_33325 [Coccomyxa subellipsoidea C-169]|eukprot:XP_005647119.1 hypothetical protein COCSUDRAFT_33325 [Coccomyxa subellipsoidea C-169]
MPNNSPLTLTNNPSPLVLNSMINTDETALTRMSPWRRLSAAKTHSTSSRLLFQ